MMESKNWKYVNDAGNPDKPDVYWVVLIHDEWKDGEKTGRKVAEIGTRYFADLDKDPMLIGIGWKMQGEPDHGLAWTEQVGSTEGEKVWAWMEQEDLPDADLPEGVEWEDE